MDEENGEEASNGSDSGVEDDAGKRHCTGEIDGPHPAQCLIR